MQLVRRDRGDPAPPRVWAVAVLVAGVAAGVAAGHQYHTATPVLAALALLTAVQGLRAP